MQDTHQSPHPPNNLPAPPKSNKKLRVILGSIASVMSIMLGGCGGSAQSGDYPTSAHSTSPPAVTTSNSTSPSANMTQTHSEAEAPASRAVGLTGTWSGTLQCSNGQTLPSTFKVAGSGNPIYQYRGSSGPREAELTSSGQEVQYVPPGGGVVTLTVNSLSTSSDHISFALNITEEKTSGETLDQSEASITADAKLSGAELEVEMNISSQAVVSQPGIVLPDDGSAGVCRGRLRKE